MFQLCNTRISIIAEVQCDSILSPYAIADPPVVSIGLHVKEHGVRFDVSRSTGPFTAACQDSSPQTRVLRRSW